MSDTPIGDGPEYFPDVFPTDRFPQWHHVEAGGPELPPRVWLSETTHRDGQQGGLPLTTERSCRVYDLLCKVTGTSGAIGQAEFFPYQRSDRDALVWALERHRDGAPIEPTTWIRGRREDVELIADLGIVETGLLSSASDHHVFHKYGDGGRSRAAEMYLEAVEVALDHGIRPRVHLEDTTRAHPDFVRGLVDRVLELAAAHPAGLAPRFRVCDTLGIGLPYADIALPRSVPNWITLLRGRGLAPEQIEMHPHNDTGLVVANCLAAIRAGCGVISGTSLGTGERTGNAPLENVLLHLLGMGYFPDGGVDLRPLNDLARVYDEVGHGPSAKYPLFGRDAFTTRAGIHADGLNKSWWMYAPFNAPLLVGRELEVALTKDSGLAGVVFMLRRHRDLDLPKSDERVRRIHAWLDGEFSGGRVTPVEWPELEPVADAVLAGAEVGTTPEPTPEHPTPEDPAPDDTTPRAGVPEDPARTEPELVGPAGRGA